MRKELKKRITIKRFIISIIGLMLTMLSVGTAPAQLVQMDQRIFGMD